MQIHSSSLNGAERPCAPADCALCAGCCKLHRHGKYPRHFGIEGEKVVMVQRYLCPRCLHTWSVIPANMLPRRSVPVRRLEQLLDTRFGLADGDARPPPASEKEKGCIRRAIQKLSERTSFLCGLLGQQMPPKAHTDTDTFWRALRKLGSTEITLVLLARDFKTSLLACYQSLVLPASILSRAPA